MKKFDKNNSGNIDEEEFTELMLKYQFNKDSSVETHLINTFSLYDNDNDKYISKSDLLRVANDVEDLLTPDDAELMISMAKTLYDENRTDKEKANDRDGLSYSEFENFLLSINFVRLIKPEDILKTSKDKPGNSSVSNKTGQNTENNSNISKLNSKSDINSEHD